MEKINKQSWIAVSDEGDDEYCLAYAHPPKIKTECHYEIFVAPQPGQIFRVGESSEKALAYKLARVRKNFPGMQCKVRYFEVKTAMVETQLFDI